MAKIAETQNHHPDIEINYDKVKISITDHEKGGVFCFMLYLYIYIYNIMNRSYSKIRHIQEANLILEKKLLSEQSDAAFDRRYSTAAAAAKTNTDNRVMIQSGVNIISSALNKIGEYTLAQFMEDLREFLSSGTGMIIQIILEGFPGFGQVINVSSWSLLALYDVTMVKPWNWMNIIVDIVGVITTGPGGKYIKDLLSKVKNFAGGTIEVFAAAVKKHAPKAFQYLLTILKSISSFISKVSTQFKEILGYLAKFMKDTQIYKGLVKMEAQMSKAFSGILSKIKTAFGENIVKNVGKSVNYTKHVGQHYAQHQTQHDLTHNVAGALVH